LHGLGPEVLHAVADFQFGRAEQVAIRPAGQQPGQGQQILLGGLPEYLENALGFGFLFGG
jgi:hypothetical protein